MTPIPQVRFVASNRVGRDFVVGDLHGCMPALRVLLQQVEFHAARDRLFSVGDLIDRGPASSDALSLLREPWFTAVRGNHEQMLIDHLRRPDLKAAHDGVWLSQAYRSFTERQQFAARWLPTLDRLPLVLGVGLEDPDPTRRFYVVHAELLEDRASVTQSMIEHWSFERPGKAMHRALWGRSLVGAWWDGHPVDRAHVPDLPLIVCGHTVLPGPRRLARQAFIDRGAYLAYDLSALEKARTEAPHLRPALCMIEPATLRCWSVDAASGDPIHERLADQAGRPIHLQGANLA